MTSRVPPPCRRMSVEGLGWHACVQSLACRVWSRLLIVPHPAPPRRYWQHVLVMSSYRTSHVM